MTRRRSADRRIRIGVPTFGADGGASGIGTYLVELLDQWSGLDGDVDFELAVHPSERDIFERPGLSTHFLSDRLRPPMGNIAWHQLGLPGWSRRRRFDVVFLPAGNRRLPWRLPCPSVGAVHDFSALHVAGKYDSARSFYITRILPRLVRRLTHVIAPSQSSKRDIVELAGVPADRVDVIPDGVDLERFHPGDRDEASQRIASRLGFEGPYLLYVSRLEHPGKNHVRLIEAFAKLKSSRALPHRLVLVGKDWCRAEEIHRAAEASPAAADIVFPGFVAAADLPTLYQAADLVVFPSLYEGFGLPILEAMASGTPVACSNTSSMPEVAADAALLFDPKDTDSIADVIERIVVNPSLSYWLRGMGLERSSRFCWRQTAARTLEVLRMAATRDHESRRSDSTTEAARLSVPRQPLESSLPGRLPWLSFSDS